MLNKDISIDDTARQFLSKLFELSGGSIDGQSSMYDVGSGIGLDRPAAKNTAENLMGYGMVEVRTLAGGVGLTKGGIEALQEMGIGDSDASLLSLGDDPVLHTEQKAAVDTLVATIKTEGVSQDLTFDGLAEFVADMRTIDAQMASPKPKTAVIKACLISLRQIAGDQLEERTTKKIDQMTA
jgi:hypothetical protein